MIENMEEIFDDFNKILKSQKIKLYCFYRIKEVYMKE